MPAIENINESGPPRASSALGTPFALVAAHETEKEAPMQMYLQTANITADDYFKLPHDFRENFELDYGKLVRLRRRMPSYGHQRYAFWLAVALDNFCGETERSRH